MSWRAGQIHLQCKENYLCKTNVSLKKHISIVFPMDRYLDVKDSSEFQRYTSSCQTHKEADEGMEEVGKKEMREMEVKEEEEVVEEEKRQHGRVRIHQNQILKSISNIHPPGGIHISHQVAIENYTHYVRVLGILLSLLIVALYYLAEAVQVFLH